MAERLVSLREQRGLSQRALGQEAGVERTMISRWESAVCPPEKMRVRDALRLARALHVTLGSLVGEGCDQ